MGFYFLENKGAEKKIFFKNALLQNTKVLSKNSFRKK